MKTMFIIIVAFTSLGVGAPKAWGQPDSCLKMYWISPDHIHDPNPDSVLADSCIGSPTYGKLYARQWFYIDFLYYVLPVPSGPEDTIIERTWQDIDTAYPAIRAAFDSLEQKFGNFVFQKRFPTTEDTSYIGTHAFLVRFDTYVDIDSVAQALHNVPLLDTSGYWMREVVTVYVRPQPQTYKNNIDKIVLSRNDTFSPSSFDDLGDKPIDCYDMIGKHIFSLRNKDYLLHSLRTLPTGSYLILSASRSILILITD